MMTSTPRRIDDRLRRCLDLERAIGDMSIDIDGVMRAMRSARTHWRYRDEAKLRVSAKYVFDMYVGEQVEC